MSRRRWAERIFDHIDTLNAVAVLAVLLLISGVGMLVWDLVSLGAAAPKTDANYSTTLGDRVLTLSLHVRVSIALVAASLLGMLGMLHVIKRQTTPSPPEPAILFNNYADFFESLSKELRKNPTTVFSSALRRTSQEQMPDSAVRDYYDGHSRWLRENTSATAQRLLPRIDPQDQSPSARSMREFVARNRAEAKASGRLSLHEVDWDFKYPVINIAILDGQVAYLAFLPRSGSTADGKWVRVESRAVARFLLEGYFHELRSMGSPL